MSGTRRADRVKSVSFHADQPFFSAPGGIGTYVRELAPALSAADPELEVRLFHARFPEGPPPERWMRDHWVEEIPATIKALYPQWNLLGRPALPEGLASTDVLHATNHAAIPPAGTNQALVVTVHDLAFERFPELFPRAWRLLFKTGLRAAVRRADAIVTPSRSTAEDLISRTRARPERIHVVPLAASLPAGDEEPSAVRARLKVPDRYVLFVGTLEPRKNLVTLIRAYRRVAGRGARHALVLAGPMGWGSTELLRELALGGPGEVILTGSMPAGDLDALWRDAAVFVYPSIYEGFGLPPLEAMKRGVPVVCSTASSLPEVVGDAALGVEPGSVAGIADAIGRVLEDGDLAERLVNAGRKRADTFSWEHTARATLDVYEQVRKR